jgi:glycolate oxidase
MFKGTKYIKSFEALKAQIGSKVPGIYVSSKTSTVIPYDFLVDYYKDEPRDVYLVDISGMDKKISHSGEILEVTGAVTWEEAIDYLNSYNLELMTYPTELSASILGGIATSATGEQSFSFGSLRTQVISATQMNCDGEFEVLDHAANKIASKLVSYHQKLDVYQGFKNPPFPICKSNLDKAIGMEGQLGVLTSAKIKVIEKGSDQYFFILLPRWEEDYQAHLEILEKVQSFRDKFFVCELLDSQSLQYLQNPIGKNQDAIFFKIRSENVEEVFESFFANLENVEIENIFEISRKDFTSLRVEVPRTVNEINSRRGVKKVGTDTQVKICKMSELFDYYRDFTQLGVRYNLFGHFGDAHLHFNFMVENEQQNKLVHKSLNEFYVKISRLGGSPFAEHGVGVLKKKFMGPFLNQEIREGIGLIKDTFDPNCIFFPQGPLKY